jgi:general secretion pathway protein D
MVQVPNYRKGDKYLLLALISLNFCLEGCRRNNDLFDPGSQSIAGTPAISSHLAPPKNLTADLPGASPPMTGESSAVIYRGQGTFLAHGSLGQTMPPSEGGEVFTLNFVNADVAEVAKVVLGDMLHLGYAVDGPLQGSITLRSSRPLNTREVLLTLENALRQSGAALVRSGSLYRIMALSEAGHGGYGQLGIPSTQHSAGYGTDVVELRYVSAADMLRLLGQSTGPDSHIKADDARNVLMVTGTSQERAAIGEAIALFDVDYMSGMSFGLFHLREASASAVVSELTQIVGGKGGAMEGVVRFVALDRLNSVLAVTSQRRYLDQVRGWISRLDQAGATDERRVFVYNVQNGRAKDLATVLSRVLGGGDDRGAGASGPGPASSGTAQPPSDGSASEFGGGLQQAPAPAAAAASANPLLGPATASSSQSSGRELPHVTADEVNNSILVYSTASEYRNLQETLSRMDVPPMHVMLEAAIAEVDLNSELNFGIQYFFETDHNQLSTLANAAISAAAPGLAYTFTLGKNIKATLDALASVTNVKIISAPKVLVLNNQQAKLEVGDDVPITTQSAQSTSSPGAPIVNSVEYRETGVILRVTPRVNQNGLVQMDVSQEVSNVSETSTSAVSPSFTQRKISSTVSVQDGETIALGGLITDSRTKALNAVPYLSDIPYLGQLFRQKDNKVTRTELLVLITPHVVQSVQRLRVITGELRQHMNEIQQLLEH